MINLNNLYDWNLSEADDGDHSAPDAFGPPVGGPGFSGPGGMPNNAARPQGSQQQKPPKPEEPPEDEPVDDPQAPDVPEEEEDDDDFETWRSNYFELAIKSDTNEMLASIEQVRDRQLDAAQRRFVEDNFQIVTLRQDANFDKASKEIRKQIIQELDRNSPAVSLLQHIQNTLQAYPVLQNIFIKLAGQGGLKSELHRRMIGALLGAVQLGSGPGSDKPDLIYVAQDFTVDISTRFQTTWTDLGLGRWTLEQGAPEEYLSESELERLQKGSPEEKRVLRRRICVESVADKYSKRAFLIHVVDPQSGDLSALAIDLAEMLRSGYQMGKLVVRKRKSSVQDIMIEDDGEIINLFSYSMNYRKTDEEAEASAKEVPFIEQNGGMLFLTAEPETIQEVAGGMPGIFYQVYPYGGNPSDITSLLRTFPSTIELLMRRQ